MELKLDSDVKAVLEFMQQNIPAEKLVGVAEGVLKIGQSLWGQYRQATMHPLCLLSIPATSGSPQAASE